MYTNLSVFLLFNGALCSVPGSFVEAIAHRRFPDKMPGSKMLLFVVGQFLSGFWVAIEASFW